jgi:predicted CxxxxCH...CXXCH cytochrome family protein
MRSSRSLLRLSALGVGMVLALFALGGCSELSDELPPASSGPGDVHPEGWVDESSSSFHGAYLKTKNWETQECRSCHGALYDGGTSQVSCLSCHSAFPHSVVFTSSAGYHPGYLQANLYPLTECRSCHGTGYQGGARVDVSCTTSGCHVDAAGTVKTPEACNTCHGVFTAPESDLLSPAPPKSVAGGTATSDPRVGAHQAHLRAGLGKVVKCQECHSVPTAWDDANHITPDLRAEVLFNDTLANLATNNGAVVPSPAYNATTNQCSSVYCHGTFKGGNLSNAPTWNGTNQAACGTCHGTLSNPAPTSGHPQGASSLNCQNCHITSGIPIAQYSSGSGTWSIVDMARHVNGKLSLFGTEAAY